jgi:rhodanese-related sulfurtransferase
MLNKTWIQTALEISLILLISACAGIAWNWSLLSGAWRGEPTRQATQQAATTQAPAAEMLPMPIGLMQVKELHDAKEAVLVDARSVASFAEGHIAGAIVLPVAEARKSPPFPAGVTIPKDATIIVYCNGFSCHDSMEVGKVLMQAGYASVYVFEGGYPEWRDAGYPVATGGAS